jgi:uncharacterized protein (TIGR02996 family)
MNHQDAFLKALAENEDDTTTRLVYADWLDDHGQHEEADRQRKWTAAKAWLVRFCQDHNPHDEDLDERVISYEEVLKLGQEAINEPVGDAFDFFCGNNMSMSESLNTNCQEFWKNWSIVTGVALPADIEKKTYFSCAC